MRADKACDFCRRKRAFYDVAAIVGCGDFFQFRQNVEIDGNFKESFSRGGRAIPFQAETLILPFGGRVKTGFQPVKERGNLASYRGGVFARVLAVKRGFDGGGVVE